MELASKEIHRALAYVAALNKHGYSPTTAEFDAYASSPGRKPLGMLGRIAADMPWYDYEGLQESVRDYLQRVYWVSSEGGQVRITDLGRVVLAALDEEAHQVEGPIEVVLDPQDPIVLSRVVKRLTAAGKALLVDPYFRLEQLLSIVNYTEIDRVLMSDQVERDNRNSLKHALDTLPTARRMEVRVATKQEMHDRYVIPTRGPITFIGTSLGSVGRRLTVIGQLGDASEEIRQHYEATWQKADILGVAGAVESDGSMEEQPASARISEGREDHPGE